MYMGIYLTKACRFGSPKEDIQLNMWERQAALTNTED